MGCLTGSFNDHFPTYLIKKRTRPIVDLVEVRKRKNYNCEQFGMKLTQLDWSVLNLLSDVNEIWNMINSALLYELNLRYPYVYV